jgi:hypothetical protein
MDVHVIQRFWDNRRGRCAMDLRKECAISRIACIYVCAGCLLFRWFTGTFSACQCRRHRCQCLAYEHEACSESVDDPETAYD